ncbi:hypothetical protein HNR73_000340 [Phytomonospora endophytica]|uniref:Uncharacterized protein n=1 Tax=Phytomonospora endophytica TaxID=714109 RepID=A0A841FF85_9ACTN|nr:hypothetical protein [Phytomonospora endophytica]
MDGRATPLAASEAKARRCVPPGRRDASPRGTRTGEATRNHTDHADPSDRATPSRLRDRNASRARRTDSGTPRPRPNRDRRATPPRPPLSPSPPPSRKLERRRTDRPETAGHPRPELRTTSRRRPNRSEVLRARSRRRHGRAQVAGRVRPSKRNEATGARDRCWRDGTGTIGRGRARTRVTVTGPVWPSRTRAARHNRHRHRHGRPREVALAHARGSYRPEVPIAGTGRPSLCDVATTPPRARVTLTDPSARTTTSSHRKPEAARTTPHGPPADEANPATPARGPVPGAQAAFSSWAPGNPSAFPCSRGSREGEALSPPCDGTAEPKRAESCRTPLFRRGRRHPP